MTPVEGQTAPGDAVRYADLCREHERLTYLESAAFARYWKKLHAGHPTSGAALSRIARRVEALRTDLQRMEQRLELAGIDHEAVWLYGPEAATWAGAEGD